MAASVCSVSGMSQCVKRVCLRGLRILKTPRFCGQTVGHSLGNGHLSRLFAPIHHDASKTFNVLTHVVKVVYQKKMPLIVLHSL